MVSTGFHRTHMTVAAHEAAARGSLALAITGAYPTRRVRRAFSAAGLGSAGRTARMLERDERLPEDRLHPLAGPELCEEAARVLARLGPAGRLYPGLSVASMRLYGHRAARTLAATGLREGVFHFRAGFGHASVGAARRQGLVALCDHAAVHPSLVDELLARRGDLDAASRAAPARPRHPLWRAMLADLEAADAIVVNSGLLSEMFTRMGTDPGRVHVVPLGVDEQFLAHAASAQPRVPGTGPLRLLFAGRFESDKGAEALIAALDGLDATPWTLEIAGPVAEPVHGAHPSFFSDPRVTQLGTIDRASLAARMKAAEVFVFPSLAEGSARVVFEALACGCYVVTTPNAGSVVEDGVHGALVPADAPGPLREAIAAAAADRTRLASTGDANAALVASGYGQDDYGAALASLYERLAAEG